MTHSLANAELHRPNISLSAFSESPIPITTSHTKYIPPHPQKGSPYHRYVLLLVPQSHPTENISIPVPTEEERLGFNYRAFSEHYGLDAGKGGGAFMWREVWDETVSQIYRDTLSKFLLTFSNAKMYTENVCLVRREGRARVCSLTQAGSLRRSEAGQKVSLGSLSMHSASASHILSYLVNRAHNTRPIYNVT